MDYNKLSKTIHQQQKDAGWYNEYRSDNTLLLLIKSELFEAFEAYRKNGLAQSFTTELLDNLRDISENERFATTFKEQIKDSVADEFADVMIRILDFVGYKKIELPILNQHKKNDRSDFLEEVLILDQSITKLYHRDVSGKEIGQLIELVKEICAKYDYNLNRHIQLKLTYNKTRGKKHGNKMI